MTVIFNGSVPNTDFMKLGSEHGDVLVSVPNTELVPISEKSFRSFHLRVHVGLLLLRRRDEVKNRSAHEGETRETTVLGTRAEGDLFLTMTLNLKKSWDKDGYGLLANTHLTFTRL